MIKGKGVTNPSYKQRTIHHAALLGFMATITSAIVVIGNMETHKEIIQRQAEDMKASLSQVVHPDIYTNEILKDTLTMKYKSADKTIYRARNDGQVVAVAFQMTTNGYSGPIKIIMGINARSELLGVRVLSHTETPGLGDKIEAKKSNWIFSFDNESFSKLKPDMWKVKKDKGFFDQFTGATITPRAVVKAVKAGMDFFTDHKAEILDKTQTSPASEQDSSVEDKAEHHASTNNASSTGSPEGKHHV
jgi:electron transport complex protein RnfG